MDVERERNIGEVVDPDALLAIVGSDLDLLKELVEIFTPEYLKLFAELQRAIAGKDPSGLRTSAHAIKSLTGNFCARRAYDAAQKLEEMGRQADFANAKEASARLDSETQAMKTALEQFIARLTVHSASAS